MDQPTPRDDASAPAESENNEERAAPARTEAPAEAYHSDRLARSWGAALSSPPPAAR